MPSITNGLLSGFDQVPPLFDKVGRVLGLGELARIRHVFLPAALPGYLGGLKQGWAFTWRSLLAGELLVAFSNKASLGFDLTTSRELSDASGLLFMEKELLS